MTRRKSSQRWLKEHDRDEFVQRAAREGYRSRAAYKLEQIDARDRLLRPGQVVVDLGAAPGGWSQYAARRLAGAGRIVAVDVLAMDPVPGVEVVRGDFAEDEVLERLRALLDGAEVDVVLSDMAPNLTGIRSADQARAMALAEIALDFAEGRLARGGALLVKAFMGEGYDGLLGRMRGRFRTVAVRKPRASRGRSAEVYLLGRGYGV